MMRTTTRVAGMVFVVLTLTTLTLGVAVAHNGTVLVGDSVETENRTVTHNGTAYTVSAVGRVNSGDPLTVRATSPSNVNYVHLYDSNGSIIFDRHTEVNESVTLETTGIAPGEYLVTTHDPNGTFHAVQPVVVTGYDTSLITSSMETNEDQRQFTVNVTETAQTPPIERVEVVVRSDANETTRVPTSVSTEGTYTGTADLEPGEYQAYAEVTAGGEVVGLSNATTVTVAAQNETTQANESTQSTQSTQASETTQTTTAPNASAGAAVRDTVESRLSELVGSRVANLMSGPLFVVVLLVGVLLLSTVVYQTAYSLRRR
ncbi:hypothetical protein SAMN04487950_2111 [Halogranum rubrum]|uniref:Uncharacterized protein n=1 Tax=Halogranum rubrum TaxID=553466 RepID=A0A1I4EIM5_9EURY|nr:hypothetical protein [Halogranum rubrum]SFL04001.1 hypothetical protein SAMN04487950_2111 [Halogranum rubrum]